MTRLVEVPAGTRSPDHGGDGVEYPNTLTKALPLTRDIDMIITGHGGVAKPQDLEVHRDFMRDFLECTRQAKKAGQTAAAAAKAWKLPARYVGYEADPNSARRHGIDLSPVAIAKNPSQRYGSTTQDDCAVPVLYLYGIFSGSGGFWRLRSRLNR